ncbi:DgyrCDS14702 [Dimorphilus gyrociliatus]|uniref:DgyrCDS14702 n=1 Tax=Dimorphilus gyrociliatus TaxID=2664684 RepID=A0A7I8WES6_9ANNE|nr:DgyrCDS14702 [Dimorphilus gyrociliatus]
MEFYYFSLSPLSRSVLFTAKILDVKLNLKVVNLLKGEQKNEEYAKINPHSKVPTLVDGDFVLSESRAIITYLFNKHGKSKDDYLYPKELKKRAKVDQFLYYTASAVGPALLDYFGVVFAGQRQPTEEEKSKFEGVLADLDRIYFQNSSFIFGDKPTLADLDLAAVLQQMELIKVDYSKYPRISKFLNAAKKSEFFKAGQQEFKQITEALLKR